MRNARALLLLNNKGLRISYDLTFVYLYYIIWLDSCGWCIEGEKVNNGGVSLKKCIFLMLLMFLLVNTCACESRKLDEKSTSETFEVEEDVKREYPYDFFSDDNIIWGNMVGGYNPAYENVNGYDLWGRAYKVYAEDEYVLKKGELYAISVSDGTQKMTCQELYDNYIKQLNVKSEFYGMKEISIEKMLREREKDRYTEREILPARITIFVSAEELKDIIENGCLDDKKLQLDVIPTYEYVFGERIVWWNIVEQYISGYECINGFYLGGPVYAAYSREGFALGKEELFPLSISDGTKKMTCQELYNSYIKHLNVKSEFYGMSESTVRTCLEIIENNRYTEKEVFNACITVFVSLEELRDVVEKGCPDGMVLELNAIFDGKK